MDTLSADIAHRARDALSRATPDQHAAIKARFDQEGLGAERVEAILSGDTGLGAAELWIIAYGTGQKLGYLAPETRTDDIGMMVLCAQASELDHTLEPEKRTGFRIAFSDVLKRFGATALAAVLAASGGGGLALWMQQDRLRQLDTVTDGAITALIDQSERVETQGLARVAQAGFESAQRFAEARALILADNANAHHDAGQADFYIGQIHYRAGDIETAQTHYTAYYERAARALSLEPNNLIYQGELGFAERGLAVMHYRRGELDQAEPLFEASQNRLIPLAGRIETVTQDAIANGHAWRSDVALARGRFDEALEAREAQLALYGPQSALWAQARAIEARAWLLVYQGDAEAAEQSIAPMMDEVERALAELREAGEVDLRLHRRRLMFLRLIAYIRLAEDRTLSAHMAARYAESAEVVMTERTDRRIQPLEAGHDSLLMARSLLAGGDADGAQARAESALSIYRSNTGLSLSGPMAMAAAYEVLGDALAARGMSAPAQRAWQDGLDALDAGPGHALDDSVRARLAWRLGDEATARAAHARLTGAGFAEPAHMAFWADTQRARSVFAPQGDQDG